MLGLLLTTGLRRRAGGRPASGGDGCGGGEVGVVEEGDQAGLERGRWRQEAMKKPKKLKLGRAPCSTAEGDAPVK